MITPFYAAVLALIYTFLSVRTLRLRRMKRIIVGDGDDMVLTRAVRAHSNFAEYTPIAILLIYFLEVQSQGTVIVHALGCVLILGRVIHAWGISQTNENIRFRVAGMALTLACIISASLRLLISSL